MTRSLLIRPQAELDVANAVRWYEEQRAGLGDEFVIELDSILRRAILRPLQFPQIKNDIRRALLRRFPYAVYFRVGEETMDLIAVLHQHRDPRIWERRVVAESEKR